MSTKRRKRRSPDEIVRKLRDADAMLDARNDLAAVLQSLEVSESTLEHWRGQYGGMKSRSDEPALVKLILERAREPPRFGDRRIATRDFPQAVTGENDGLFRRFDTIGLLKLRGPSEVRRNRSQETSAAASPFAA